MKKFFKYGGFWMLTFFLFSTVAFGQETTGSIEGYVKDSTGAVVPNVTVSIETAKKTASGTTTTGIGVGFNRTITTNEDGFFRVLQVPPGTYDVMTTATGGFGEARYENVVVVIGKNTQLDMIVNPEVVLTQLMLRLRTPRRLIPPTARYKQRSAHRKLICCLKRQVLRDF